MKKKEKVEELSKLSKIDLSLKINELSEQLLKARIKKSMGQLENSAVLKVLRKDICRAKFFYSKA